jgi:hypothetical protein
MLGVHAKNSMEVHERERARGGGGGGERERERVRDVATLTIFSRSSS